MLYIHICISWHSRHICDDMWIHDIWKNNREQWPCHTQRAAEMSGVCGGNIIRMWRECHDLRTYSENKHGTMTLQYTACGGKVYMSIFLHHLHVTSIYVDISCTFKCHHISTARCVLQDHCPLLCSLYTRMSWHSRHIRITFPPHTPHVTAARCEL